MQKLVICVLLLGFWGASFSIGGFAQASASSFASSQGPVRATVGTFFLEEGSPIAFELHRADPCQCMCEPILVSGLKVIDKNETPVFTDEWAPIPAEDWTGRWDLIDSQGRSVTGRYTVVIETSIGEFRAEVEIVPKGERSYSGRVSMQASVCGFGLSVYRLIEKEAAGATIDVQSGEKIMLALPGNPTTGYSWEASEEPSAEILRPLPGEPYRPESSLIGAGGTFLFRYEAVGPGEVTLNFVYHRPWERTPPQNSFSIRIVVH